MHRYLIVLVTAHMSCYRLWCIRANQSEGAAHDCNHAAFHTACNPVPPACRPRAGHVLQSFRARAALVPLIAARTRAANLLTCCFELLGEIDPPIDLRSASEIPDAQILPKVKRSPTLCRGRERDFLHGWGGASAPRDDTANNFDGTTIWSGPRMNFLRR